MNSNLIFAIFLFFLCIQFVYYLFIYLRVIFKKPNRTLDSQNPLSLLISAKNESENLENNLPKILSQNYDQFEVIVINDRSTDSSFEILSNLKKKYNNLRVINILDSDLIFSGKKNALTVGIKNAKYDYLVFTDADCSPVSKKWLMHIMNAYTQDTEIVLGYGGYDIGSGFLNKLIRFETLSVTLQYMSYAMIGIPYMGVGRNLSYRKSSFNKVKGFESHSDILSGDDDLFVNQLADKKNTEIVIDKESITRSIPKKTVKEYILQKRRHLLTGMHYKRKHKFLLGLEILSRFFFYFFGFISILLNINPFIVIVGYIVRLIIQIIIFGIFSNKLNEKKVLIFIPIFDIFIPLINLYIVLSNNFFKRIPWK